MKKVVIACGGTGGHIAPGIALAQALQNEGIEVKLYVSQKKVDAEMLKKYPDIPYVTSCARPFSKNIVGCCRFLGSQWWACLKALKWLSHEKVDAVIGMGGFTNVPVVLAAWLLRKRIFLHESNQVMGKSIRCLSKLADVVFLPEGGSRGHLSKKVRVVECGMPVRQEIQKQDKKVARQKMGLYEEGVVVGVLGGSQGARMLTQWAYDTCESLNLKKISVCCICGGEGISKVKENKIQFCKNLFLPFCENMSNFLNSVDVLVCRSGAGTIAEAEKMQVPMILVPYPNSADHHQDRNAEVAQKKGFGVIVPQDCLSELEERLLVFLQKIPAIQWPQRSEDPTEKMIKEIKAVCNHV